MGFNMLDPTVGGASERSRKLRQAIAIAVDYEEYISIFRNGRGVAAQGVIPPGIYGYAEGKDGINPYSYDWLNDKARRKKIDAARCGYRHVVSLSALSERVELARAALDD